MNFKPETIKILKKKDKLYSKSFIDKNNRITLINANLNMDNIKQLHQYNINPKFFEYLEYKPYKEISETYNYVKNHIEKYKANYETKLWFVVLGKKKIIGTAKIENVDFYRKSLEWGYGINPNEWGNGYLFQIQSILLNYIFKKLKFNRLYGNTFITNKKTIQSLKNNYFRKEGISYQFYKNYKNEYIDAYRYSLIREDFIKKKKYNKIKKLNISKEIIENIIKKISKYKERGFDSMKNNPNWDSLNHINLVCKLENMFKIKFNNQDIQNLNSVELIYKILNNKK